MLSCRAIKERFKLQSAKRRKSSSKRSKCNRKDRAGGIRLELAKRSGDVVAKAGQEQVVGIDKEEVIMTARTNDEPQK